MSKTIVPGLAALVCVVALASCATQVVVFKEMPKPAESSRLRVFVQPLQNEGRWGSPYSEFAANTVSRVKKVWFDTGIFDVVSDADADAALGSSRKDIPWKAENYEIARRAAKAVRAEYAMLVERRNDMGFYWETTLINALTGAVFNVSMPVSGGRREEFHQVAKASYRQIFKDAKGDILLTAKATRSTGFDASSVPPPNTPVSNSKTRMAALPDESGKAASRVPVAVFDFKSADADRLVSNILTEALRAELVALARYDLVARENIDEIMRELSVQTSGAVDETQALKIGVGLAAKQIVVGVYGMVGKLTVIQAKRIDVESQKVLGTASVKCEAGKEDEFFSAMASFAGTLSEGR